MKAPFVSSMRAIGIGWTLVLGFGIIGAVLSVALFVAFAAGSRVEQALQRIAEQSIPQWSEAYEASLEVAAMSRALRDAVLIEVQEDLPVEVARIGVSRVKVNALLFSLQQRCRTADEAALLAKVRASAAAYRQDQVQFIDELQGGARGQARGMLAGVLRVSQANYLRSLDDFRALQAQQMQASAAAVRAAMTQMRRRMMLSFLLVAVIGCGVAMGLLCMLGRRLGAEPHVVAAAMGRVAQGDLTPPLGALRARPQSVIGSMREMVASLRAAVVQVRTASADVAEQSQSLAEESLRLSQRTEQQSAELEEAAAALEQFSATMAQSRESITQADQLAHTSGHITEQSCRTIEQAVAKMQDVVAHGIHIAEMATVLDSVAFQTNILALNAAVEAAHAGDRGLGFAVVASEVRSLAMGSADSARHVRELVLASNARIDECQVLIHQAKNEHGVVNDSVRAFLRLMASVQTAISEQAAGIRQLTEVLSRIDQFTQRNAALVAEAKLSSGRLHAQSVRLMAAVSHFSVGDE